MADEAREALRRVEQRLEQASERAERLLRDATQASRGPKPPPAGWQTPNQSRSASSSGGELEAVINAIRALRDLIPPEAVARLAEAIKELLLALRALIDAYIERLERRPPERREVRDIPIQ
jgi:hypothetical protein